MMYKFLAAFCLACTTSLTFAQVPANVSLNGSWSFITDKDQVGVQSSYPNKLPGNAIKVTVPGTWNITEGLENYRGTAWYQKDFTAPKDWAGKKVHLQFCAVYHDAVVYINGKKAGEHLNSGYNAFSIEISKLIKAGAENRVTVAVSNHYSETNLPYKNVFDWADDGGITRSVTIHVTDKAAIKYVHVTPDIDLKDSTGTATVKVKLDDATIKSAQFTMVLKERKSGKILFNGDVKAKRTGNEFSFDLKKDKVTPWHFDNPFLYELSLKVLQCNKLSDTKTVRFAYRTIKFANGQMQLNNEPVKLPGIEYMPGGGPVYGAAEPSKHIDSVIKMLKELNVVMTRFHWQQDEEWLDRMDEAGILVQEEIPWWQQPVKLTPQLMATAKMQLNEMIEAHYNHPSIFAWGLNNEVGSTKEDNEALKLFVHNLDATRMATVIGNKLDKKLAADPSLMGDIPTWNEYVGTWNGLSREDLPAKLDEISKILNGRPLLITEYGLCEPAFTGGDARRADDMFYHINEWRKKPFIAGFIYFCLNDYRTQMGEEGEGKFKIRRHGIADVYLKPKASYDIFRQICSPIEISKVVKANDTDAHVDIMVKNTIPAYTLRNYVLEYRTKIGEPKKVVLKDLKPGDKAAFTLKDVNVRYAFEIKRPTGEVVASY